MYKHIKITALRLKNSEKGFALIAAIMACLILLALGMLVIALSTQDLRVSTKIVGDKRSLAAAEEGIHILTQTFNPDTPAAYSGTTNRADLKSNYTVGVATLPTREPESVQLVGSTDWIWKRYDVIVTGTSTEYGTTTRVTVGLGFLRPSGKGGPAESK